MKTLKVKSRSFAQDKVKVNRSPEFVRNNLINELISKKQHELINSTSDIKTEINQEIKRLQRLRQDEIKGESGKLRINLSWNTTDDLDLHVQSDKGKINYSNDVLEEDGIIGKLDIDANAGTNNMLSNPQENISWDGIPKGKHIISVDFYTKREKSKVCWTFRSSIGSGFEWCTSGR